MSRSEFLVSKISHGFDYLDVDVDGVLSEHDHVLMGQRAAQAAGHQPGSHAEARIIQAYLRVWHDLHEPHLPDGVDAISKEQFIGSTSTLADDPDTARATIGAVAEAFLAIADIDQDGRLSPAEFHRFQTWHFRDISEAETGEAFRTSTGTATATSPPTSSSASRWSSGAATIARLRATGGSGGIPTAIADSSPTARWPGS